MSIDLKKYSGYIIVLSLVAGLAIPQFQIFKDFLLIMLAFIVWSSCIGISPKQFLDNLKQPKKHFLYLSIIFVIQPIFTWLVASQFIDSKLILTGFVLAAAAPAASAVVYWTKLSKGDLPLSLAFVGISHLLTPIAIPLISYILLRTYITIDLFHLAYTLTLVTVIPVILAIAVKKATFIKKHTDNISIIVIFFLLSTVISLNANEILSTDYFFLMIGIATFQVASNYTLGKVLTPFWVISEEKSLVLSVSIRNSTLTMAIALVNFGPVVALPSAFLMIVQVLFVAFLMEQTKT